VETPGDFLIVGPFFTTTSCSTIISSIEMFLAAEAFSREIVMDDFLLDFLMLFNPADSFMACSNTLTLSLTGDPVYPPTNLEVELLCLSAGDKTWAANCLTLGDAAPLVSVLSEQEPASCFCLVLVDLAGLAFSALSGSLAVFSSSVDAAIFCRVLENLTGLFSTPSVSLVIPRPPLARTFLPGLTTFPAGALELFKTEVFVETPGDFLIVGPFFTTTSCSTIISSIEMFLAAEAFSREIVMDDFLLDFLMLFNPADSFMACSNTLTLSLTGDPVYPPTNLEVELLCLSAGDKTWAANCLTLGDAAPLVSVLSEQEPASCFCLVLVDLAGLAFSALSGSLAVFSSSVDAAIFCRVLEDLTGLFSTPSVSLADLSSSVEATIFCLVLEDLTGLLSSPSVSLAVLSSSVERIFCLVLVDLVGGAESESPLGFLVLVLVDLFAAESSVAVAALLGSVVASSTISFCLVLVDLPDLLSVSSTLWVTNTLLMDLGAGIGEGSLSSTFSALFKISTILLTTSWGLSTT